MTVHSHRELLHMQKIALDELIFLAMGKQSYPKHEVRQVKDRFDGPTVTQMQCELHAHR